MYYTKENIKEGILAKINEINDVPEELKMRWRERLPQYPIEVEQNVLEWLNDEPITEINCHGESIKWVMDTFKLKMSQFPFILDNFVEFKNTYFIGNMMVFNGFC